MREVYRMKKITVFLAVIMLAFPVLLFAGGQKESGGKAMKEGNEITLYTSLETDETEDYIKAAEATTGLKINWTRFSTGVLGAKLLAEKENPQADLVYGWAVTYLMDFTQRGFFEPYVPKDGDKIPARFKDPNNYWYAIDLYLAAFCVNTEKLKEYGLPMPTSWADLTNPVYAGHIIMPNPASSGTGFLQVAGILETMDPDYKTKTVADNKGWDFLAKLDKNMGQYIKSGSRPAKYAAAGEYVIGASFAFVIANLKKEGKPVQMVLPSEGSAYELEANALMKGAKHPNNAKKFLDWAISDEAMNLYAKWKVGVTKPGIPPARPDLPKLSDIKLIPMDFNWQSANRGDILITWQDKFLR
jgi:iron(III) transport system substrate-binding protein